MRSKCLVVPFTFLLLICFAIPTLLVPGTARAESWQQLAGGGFAGHYRQAGKDANCMATFNGKMYLGTGSGWGGEPCAVRCYNGSSWTQVNKNGFGNSNNNRVTSLAVYNGYLYAGTGTSGGGCAIYRTNGTGGAPYQWTKVTSSSNLGSRINIAVSSMNVNSGLLFAGTQNYSGCEVWSYNGNFWTQRVGSIPSSTIRPGFGSTNNTEATSMAFLAVSSLLFVGTNTGTGNGAQVWQYNGIGWAQSNLNGFSDTNNAAVESLTVYNNSLYAGTSNGNTGCEIWQRTGPNPSNWAQVNANGFGDNRSELADSMTVFGSPSGRLYAGVTNYEQGCQVWRYNNPGWTKVSTNGFGNISNFELACMASYNSKLYAGVSGYSIKVYKTGGTGGPPYSWDLINTPGFTSNSNYTAERSVVFQGNLYIGTGSDIGCEVWRYDGTSWTRIAANGFGDENNQAIKSMIATGSSLYVGTVNDVTGCEIWSYDGSSWVQVNKDGFGDPDNQEACSMAVFKLRLYVGTSSYQNLGKVLCFDGPGKADWTQVNNAGFGNPKCIAAYSMAIFGSQLYVGTNCSNDPCQVWRYDGPGKANWKLMNQNGFGNPLTTEIDSMAVFAGRFYAATYNRTMHGAEVWRYDGPGKSNWKQVNSNGFGDSDNSSPGDMLVVGSKLYVSTWNHLGGEVWAYNGRSCSQVNTNGFGNSGNGAIVFLCSDGTRIFAGTLNEKQGCEVWSAALPAAIWYLAEGTTAWGFDCYISIENPNSSDVTARITFMKSDGANVVKMVGLPTTSQVTVNPRDFVGDCDFSTRVDCVQGKAIAVDRTMSWTGPGASSPEGHSSVGVTAPANTWYLAEGSSAWGFECWLLIQNPNSSAATCQVNYMIEGTGLKSVVKKVPANSRKTFFMADDIGPGDASIQVFSDVPVIPERAMYRNNRREGHDSIGTTRPALTYFLSEGTTAWGFTTYVLVQNPNPIACDVTVTYMTPSGPKPQAPFPMTPNSRKTIRVNDTPEVSNTDLSTSVTGTKPIISERAMYWDNGTGEACHDSIGMDKAHMSFYLPDGQTSDGCETWTLVQNPNNKGVLVHITYMTPDGHGNVEFDEAIPANSRRTFNMVDKGISGRAAVMVTSKTSSNPIMCERAMYWNNRGAGTDTIGGYSD